ncbi:hypothetical protein Pla163_14280 [Planctomycetes bacterium Pla163]|uniref:Fe-S protein n=1 Tax=Rohdeia mirabilis TaxID=2528008 RepID=A0A518CYL2_9BACT|nr:hypothetical protein Pla163_14280 [Planctomycetes bacterium Pla163]
MTHDPRSSRTASGATDAPGVPSPCIRDCRLTDDQRLCLGCGRTLEEIVRWPVLGEDERRAVLARLGERPA